MDITYCRACGIAGHSFSKCKNAAALHDIIENQDSQLDTMRLEITSAKLLHDTDCTVQQRLIYALLDLIESGRK